MRHPSRLCPSLLIEVELANYIVFLVMPQKKTDRREPRGREVDRAPLDESCHKLFKSSMLLCFNGSHRDAELLPSRPADSRSLDEYSGMRPGKKHTKGDYRTRFNRVSPVDPPSIERKIPSSACALDLLAGVIDRTLYGESTERSYAKGGTERDALRQECQ